MRSVVLDENEKRAMRLRANSELFVYNLGHNYSLAHSRSESVLARTLTAIEGLVSDVECLRGLSQLHARHSVLILGHCPSAEHRAFMLALALEQRPFQFSCTSDPGLHPGLAHGRLVILFRSRAEGSPFPLERGQVRRGLDWLAAQLRMRLHNLTDADVWLALQQQRHQVLVLLAHPYQSAAKLQALEAVSFDLPHTLTVAYALQSQSSEYDRLWRMFKLDDHLTGKDHLVYHDFATHRTYVSDDADPSTALQFLQDIA